MPDIVVGDRPGLAGFNRQARLGAIERLDLLGWMDGPLAAVRCQDGAVTNDPRGNIHPFSSTDSTTAWRGGAM